MSTEENKALVRRMFEAYNKHSLAGVEELFAPDYVWHGPAAYPDMDLAAMKQVMTPFFTAFPDLHYTLEDLIAEGDKVVWRFTARATHRGEFMGIAATGKVVTYTGIVISRFAGGKCVEDWEQADMLGLMQQLGAVPQMAQAGA
jgi:steroid delta-isomerase-like uncharacterized protein